MKGSFFHILFIIIYVVTMSYEIPKSTVKSNFSTYNELMAVLEFLVKPSGSRLLHVGYNECV